MSGRPRRDPHPLVDTLTALAIWCLLQLAMSFPIR